MVTPEPHLRIPGVLQFSYKKIVSTDEGKNLMKRIRVECGVCKATRFYSIHRGITRIAGVVACEGCRQFYQRFKKQPWTVDCLKGGQCYELDETPKNKCKACWVAHILCRCPVSVNLFNHLRGYLPDELKEKMVDKPPTPEEVPEDKRGGLGLEVYKDDAWVDVTEKSEINSLVQLEEANDSDDMNELDMDVECEAEEESVDDPGVPDNENEESFVPPRSARGPPGRKGRRGAGSLDHDNEEKDISSNLDDLDIGNKNKFIENFNPKTSERVKRKKKKVQYFNNTGRNRYQGAQTVYAADGTLANCGKDLCDCLQGDCIGCHFPCPKCSSRKCGSECRMNRKWFYERVEVEGTKLYWMNEWVKKK